MPGSTATLDALLRAYSKTSFQPLLPAKRGQRCSSTWPILADRLLAVGNHCWQGRSFYTGKQSTQRLSSKNLQFAYSNAMPVGFCKRCFHSPSEKIAAPISSPNSSNADGAARSILSEEVRALLRLLTSPIVICTSVHDTQPRAMTMSSFTSLTLSPTPLITFNVRTPSRTLDAIVASRKFNVHLLEQNAFGAALADHFTRGNIDGIFKGLVDQNQGISEGEAPVISGKGILHVLRCNIFEGGENDGFMRVRDHVIIVGEVISMIPGVGTERYGLAYADRRYRKIGDVITRK